MKKPKTVLIGRKIKNIRKAFGYTQEELAEKIECSTRYIGDIEQDRSKPSYEVLVRICNTFNIGMDMIFSEYLTVEEDKFIEESLYGFRKLKENNKETIIHMIEYFNRSIS